MHARPRQADVLWIDEFEEIMKDVGLFFFEDDYGVLFVRTPASLHGGDGVLRCGEGRLVLALEVVLGVS